MAHQPNYSGFTLLEIAVLILVMAIALAPVLAGSGGISSIGNGNGTVAGEIKSAANANIVANSIMNRTIIGQIPIGDQMNATLNVNDFTVLPKGGYYRSPQRYSYDAAGQYQYEWKLRDYSYPYLLDEHNTDPLLGTQPNAAYESEMATGNRLVLAQLNVTDTRTSEITRYSSLVNVNNSPPQTPPQLGIRPLAVEFLLDPTFFAPVIANVNFIRFPGGSINTDSMPYVVYHSEIPTNYKLLFAPPYLADRFFTNTPELNYLNDAQLDITGFDDHDDPDTPYPDQFPSQTAINQRTQNLPTCAEITAEFPNFAPLHHNRDYTAPRHYYYGTVGLLDVGFPFELNNNPNSFLRNYFAHPGLAIPSANYVPWGQGSASFGQVSNLDYQHNYPEQQNELYYNNLKVLCDRKSFAQAHYAGDQYAFNKTNISEIEWIRTILLKTLLKVESNPILLNEMKIGFSLMRANFGNNNQINYWNILPVTPTVNEINPVTGLPKQYYRDFRKKLLWLNRLDLSPPGGIPRSLVAGYTGTNSAAPPTLTNVNFTSTFNEVIAKLSTYTNHKKTIVYITKRYDPLQVNNIVSLLANNNIQLIILNVFQHEDDLPMRHDFKTEFADWAQATETGQSIDLVMDPSIKQVPTTLTNLLNTRVSGVTGGGINSTLCNELLRQGLSCS